MFVLHNDCAAYCYIVHFVMLAILKNIIEQTFAKYDVYWELITKAEHRVYALP